MEKLEKVELLREKANVTYEEARSALEEADWDMLDAMVLLEREGKVGEPGPAAYSTEYEEQKDYIRVRDKVEEQENSAPNFGRTLGKAVRVFIHFLKHTVFLVKKDEDTLFQLPTIVFAILLAFFWEAIVPVMIIALFFGVRYAFDGTESVKRANRVLDSAGEFADNIIDEFSNEEN
ncbi:MAG: hypothetical protein Q4A32_00365 [Lachnospiraceae bacterium]|nr:hypothetical protein [Lachnospiraceae bacterium]